MNNKNLKTADIVQRNWNKFYIIIMLSFMPAYHRYLKLYNHFIYHL